MARRQAAPRHSFTDASRGIRLQKVMADAGIASRRAAEAMIVAGSVKVNGEIIDALPAWVDPAKDRIVVEGRVLVPKSTHVYVMLNKPTGYVCSNADPQGRKQATALVEHPSEVRLYPVGRLDMDACGLLLLTNDGELANRLTHPRYEVHKEYELLVKGSMRQEDLSRLEEAMFAPDTKDPSGRPPESHLKILRREPTRTLLTMQLREGSNKQIRSVMADLGHPVKRLKRIGVGPLRLRALAVGAWRDLTGPDIAILKKHAFADAAAIHRRRASGARGTKA